MADQTWLLLVYRVPVVPSKNRVAVWREVKKLGAIYLQNGICLLPNDPVSAEAFADLAKRVDQMEGEAHLFAVDPIVPGEQERLVAEFNRQRDQEYREVLEQCEHFRAEVVKETERANFAFGEVEEIEEDLEKLARWLKKIQARDRFDAAGKAQAEAAYADCQRLCREFAARAFVHENKRR